jgi:hypothetical protein
MSNNVNKLIGGTSSKIMYDSYAASEELKFSGILPAVSKYNWQMIYICDRDI